MKIFLMCLLVNAALLNPQPAVPSNVQGQAVISYATFITTYVNKRNPATGMYWYLDEVSAASSTSRAILDLYISRAQAFNLSVVRATGRSATERQLLSAPELTPRALQSMRKESSGTRLLAMTYKNFKTVQHRGKVCLEYTK